MNKYQPNSKMEYSILNRTRFALVAVVFFLAITSGLFTAPLTVQVSDVGIGNNIGQANTSRNVAVAPDGSIFVVFSGSTGIRVAKSTNNGITFNASVQVDPNNLEAEIEIASNGYIYVSWLSGSSVFFSMSNDAGSTFSIPAVVGSNSSGFGVHIASYGSNVYLLERDGNRLFINNNFGSGPFTTKIIDVTRVFSDVRVDQSTGIVYVMTDDPYLRLYTSYDNGVNFTQTFVTPSSFVNYSSYTLSVGPLGIYMFVYGFANQAYKIDMTNGASTTQFGGYNSNSQGRTLASDSYGNLVDGFYNFGVLKYRISFDQGTTWQPDVIVANGGSHNVAINPFNHNVLAVYEMNGQVYLNVFTNQLKVPLTVTTTSFSNVTCNSADVSGEVVNNSAGTVGTRGVVYSTSPNPTIADSYSLSGSGEGTFTANLTNLCPGKTYYARAFAKDSWGNIWYGDDVTFTTLAPTFTVTLSPALLWPPNHTMKTITASVTSDMDCSGTAVLTSITSNEADNGLGDGDKVNDIQNGTIGSQDYSFDLRAERSGTGSGRIYTVTYTITDVCGTQYTATGTVKVPFSNSKKAISENTANNVDVYPNPTNDFVNIDMNFAYSANAKIMLTDLLGNTISTFDFSDVSNIQKQIDIQNLVSGSYFVYITFGEEQFVKRIIKI